MEKERKIESSYYFWFSFFKIVFAPKLKGDVQKLVAHTSHRSLILLFIKTSSHVTEKKNPDHIISLSFKYKEKMNI